MRVHVDGKTYEYHEDEMTNLDGMAKEAKAWRFSTLVPSTGRSDAAWSS